MARLLAALLVLWLGAPALAQSSGAAEMEATEGASESTAEAGTTMEQTGEGEAGAAPEGVLVGGCVTKPAGRQTCYKGTGCKGKILSNRDKHNCKVKSGGKSWCSHDGICSNHI